MEQDDFLARKEQILNRNSAKNFKEFNIENELKDRIESHMINFEYLKQDDFDNYFIDRAKKLLNLIENAMGKNVSDRGSEDTIEQFGKSLI